MKICWDNLEGLYLTKNGTFRYKEKSHSYKYSEACKMCGEPFLYQSNSKGEFCSKGCATKEQNKKL